PGVAGGFLFRWLAKRDKSYTAETSIALNRSSPRAEASPFVHHYLEERLFIIAALLARAGSESYFTLNDPPEGGEIITRQRCHQVLRQKGLWEKMEADEAALMSIPD